jgi:hypothetical protein
MNGGGTPGSLWIGGRGGVVSEDAVLSGFIEGNDSVAGRFGQAWVELESASYTLGASMLVARLDLSSSRTGAPAGVQWLALPGFHLRLGARTVGFEAGVFDRQSAVSPEVGRVSVSGTFGDARRLTLRYHGDVLGVSSPFRYSRLSEGLGFSTVTPGLGGGLEMGTASFALGVDLGVAHGSSLFQGNMMYAVGSLRFRWP